MKYKKLYINNNHIKNFKRYKLIIFFLIIYFKLLNYSSPIFNFYSKISDLENYLKLCNSSKTLKEKKFIKNKNIKVSIISAIFNREQYILRFLRSIQNQKIKEIEIIFIDDCSKDNSVKLIEENKKIDERIILIHCILFISI